MQLHILKTAGRGKKTHKKTTKVVFLCYIGSFQRITDIFF